MNARLVPPPGAALPPRRDRRHVAVPEHHGLPPAPKLLPTGDLDPAQATAAELRGEAVFRGKGRCATCHPGPYFTDELSHDLRVERFYEGRSEGIYETFVTYLRVL